MRKTTVTCDRCGEIIPEKDQVWQIKLAYKCFPTEPDISHIQPRAEWCRGCMEELGLLGNKYKATIDNPVPPPEPTLEDIIRAIVRAEIVEGG